VVTPAEEAAMLAEMDCEDSAIGPIEDIYIPDVLKVSEEDHWRVLKEVAAARTKLAAYQAGKPVRAGREEREGESGDRSAGCATPLTSQCLPDVGAAGGARAADRRDP